METKTAVFAYGAFGVAGLSALQASGFAVVQVFTHADEDMAAGDSVALWCRQRGVPCRVHERWVDTGAVLRPLELDFIFSFYFRELIPEAVLALAGRGAFNLHGSLLPRYRGRAPINWVLVNGETQTGVTLHHMVARADAGDIVAQAPVDIDEVDTAYSLQQRMLGVAQSLLLTVLPRVADGTAPRTPQDVAAGSYFGRRTPDDGRIDWKKDAKSQYNLVRAVTKPWPGAFCYVGGKKLMVWHAVVEEASGKPGEILPLSPLVVACGKGSLRLVSYGFEDGSGYMPVCGDVLT